MQYYLYALFAQSVLVKVEDGCFNGARRRQDCQANVDGVTSFGIQNNDLLTLPICCRFLKSYINIYKQIIRVIHSDCTLSGQDIKVFWSDKMHYKAKQTPIVNDFAQRICILTMSNGSHTCITGRFLWFLIPDLNLYVLKDNILW